MAQPIQSSSITSADGLLKPTLAFNPQPINYWSVSEPFIDIMKLAGKFRTEDWRDLNDRFLDENGWPTQIPNSSSKLIQVFDFQLEPGITPFQSGTFVLSYEGTGQIAVRGADVSNVQQSNGEVTFDFGGQSRIVIEFLSTDPQGTGDYIRDISLVREENVELHEAGAIFNPEWLDVVEDASQLRFMNWMNTNNSKKSEWSDEVSADYASWSTNGVPIEVMVELANHTGTDPWFTIPHMASDDYVREFASYVRDNLDPDLIATVEYSNEAWNSAFGQKQWMEDQAKAVFNSNQAKAFDFFAKRSTEIALIWEEEFGAEADDRLIAALGAQGVNPWLTGRMLDSELWKESDPNGFVDPRSVFDALAITSYFGSKVSTNSGQRAELIEAIQNPRVDANEFLYNLLSDPSTKSSTASNMLLWAQQADLAEEAGMSLISYEGGQHVHHSFAANIPKKDLDILTEFMKDFVRSEEMMQLYEENWDAWKSISDGPYMQFQEISRPGKFGSWGLTASLDDTTPRSEYAFERNETEQAWWDDDRSGEQALQGRTILGDQSNETLVGTVQEDFLIGSGGDDILVGGRGDDGLHGGEGNDTVVLAGTPEDYEITEDGDGWRVVGLDGNDFVLEVENFRFDDGPELSLADFLNYVPGTTPPAPQQPVTPPPTPEPIEPTETLPPQEPEEEPEAPVTSPPPAAQEPPEPVTGEEEEEEVEQPIVPEEPLSPPSAGPEAPAAPEPPAPPVEETTQAPEVPEPTQPQAPVEPEEVEPTSDSAAQALAEEEEEEEEEEESGLAGLFDRLFGFFSNIFGGSDDDENEPAVASSNAPNAEEPTETAALSSLNVVEIPLLENVIPTTLASEEDQPRREEEEEEDFAVI